jgi:hypothetical protein
MKSSNQYLSPKSDAYEKALDGIDLCLKQNSSSDEITSNLYKQSHHGQNQNSQFTATGLWRKKRGVGAIKTSQPG